MARVCVLFAEGFEEIEAVTIVDVLRRAELDVTTVGVGSEAITGSHGLPIRADTTLDAAIEKEWDLVVLPGGLPGATNLRDNPQVQQLVKAQAASGRRLGAICAAPIALGSAGVLEGKKATSYPGFEKELTGAQCVEDRVVSDGNIITSRGPGTALEFSLELVRQLKDEKTASGLRQGMLVSA